MVQLTDLLAVIRPAGLDWDAFERRATQHLAAPYALAGLSLAAKLLDAPVPPALLARLSRATPGALCRRIERLDLVSLLARTQRRPAISLPQRLWRGLENRAETANWAADWRGRWRVWRTLLQPMRSDTGQLLRQRLSKREPVAH